MEAGDIYTEPLRDDEEDGGRKRTGSSVGGGLRRLSGRMSSLSGSGSLSPGRLAGQFFSFDDELVLGGSDDEPDGEDSSRQTRGSSTLRRLSRRLSGGSLGRLSEIILSQITDEISSCDDDDDEVDEEEMRPGRQRGRTQQERRRSNSQGSRPPPQRRSSAARSTAASRASDDSSWAVGEAYDRAVRRLSRRSSLPLVRPASVTPSSTAIRAAQSSPAAAAAGRRISLPSPGPAGSSIGVSIGIHGHRRFRGEGAGSTSRPAGGPAAPPPLRQRMIARLFRRAAMCRSVCCECLLE